MKEITFILLFVSVSCVVLAQEASIKISGPTSGVISVSISPMKDVIFAGSLFAGIFKSSDGGLTWSSSSEGYPVHPSTTTASTSVGKFIFDPIEKNVIYVCSGLDDTGGGGGIFKSTDGGETWTSCNNGIPLTDNWIHDLAINPLNHKQLFAVGNKSLYKSTNQGTDWLKVNGINAIGIIVFDKKDSLRINSISSDNSILESLDGGLNFQKYSLDINFVPYIRYTCIDSTTGDVYFSNYQGLYKITDWREIKYLDPNFPVLDTSAILLGNKVTRLAKISYDKKTSSIFVATFSGVFKSTNRGEDWILVSSDDYASLSYINEMMYSFSPNGVKLSTDDGLSWDLISSGPPTSIINDLAIFENDKKYLLVSTDQGVYSSSDSAVTWERIDNKLFKNASCVAFDPSNHNTIYVGLGALYSTDLGFYKSNDFGQSWEEISPQKNLPVTAIAIHPAEPNIIYIGSPGGIWRSQYGGSSWELLQVRHGPNETTVIKIANSDPKILYVTATSNRGSMTGIYVSEDKGFTWERRINGFVEGSSSTGILSLAVHPDNPQIAFAGNWQDGIYKTTDIGNSWVKLDNFPNVGLKNHRVCDIIFEPGNSNILFASIAGSYPTQMTGLYKSVDMGENWNKINDANISNNSFNKILYYKSNLSSHLLLGTFGGGLVEMTSDLETTGIESESHIADSYLSQNYPNPFNPLTEINYSIPKTDFVSLKLYNSLGQFVKNIISEIQSKGNHKIFLSANNLPSGVYYYQLKAGNFQETKKLILLK